MVPTTRTIHRRFLRCHRSQHAFLRPRSEPVAERVRQRDRRIGNPGSTVSLASGLPIHISNGTGVTAVDFTLTYDPSLLTITGVGKAAGVPSDWVVTFNNNSVAGTLSVSAYGSLRPDQTISSLPSGGLDVVNVFGGLPRRRLTGRRRC